MQLPAHGANAESLYEAMGLVMPDKVLDLSENVNAFGVPDAIKHAWPSLIQYVSRYPHEQAEPFRSAAAKVHHVLPEQLLVTNGAAEGLMALAQYFRGEDVLLLEPSFSEYKRTLKQQNCRIHSIISTDIKCYKFDISELHQTLQKSRGCYICNPNNPTGVLLEKSWIEPLIKANPSCTFVIDEAFIDWTDETESVISLISQYPNLFVVRSMTKMFAMAGVRLGYVMGQQVEKLREFLPHWSVSQLAIELGMICLGEQKFIVQSRLMNEQILKEMKTYFRSIQTDFTNASANYLLFKLPQPYNTDHFFKHLLTKGVVLRHTKNYEGLNGEWLRIAVKTEESWRQVRKEIEEYVKRNSVLSS